MKPFLSKVIWIKITLILKQAMARVFLGALSDAVLILNTKTNWSKIWLLKKIVVNLCL